MDLTRWLYHSSIRYNTCHVHCRVARLGTLFRLHVHNLIFCFFLGIVHGERLARLHLITYAFLNEVVSHTTLFYNLSGWLLFQNWVRFRSAWGWSLNFSIHGLCGLLRLINLKVIVCEVVLALTGLLDHFKACFFGLGGNDSCPDS